LFRLKCLDSLDGRKGPSQNLTDIFMAGAGFSVRGVRGDARLYTLCPLRTGGASATATATRIPGKCETCWESLTLYEFGTPIWILELER
jgi:hypothetical protein